MNYTYYEYPSNYIASSAAVAAVSAVLMTFIAIILVVYVIQIIAMWKLFNKAGEKGWKSIIPIYNMVILFKISGLSPWLILVYFATFIPIIGWIAPIALNAILCYRMAKSFDKDVAWAIGLYFLAPIFYMILAFGQSEYVGPNGEKTDVTVEENN